MSLFACLSRFSTLLFCVLTISSIASASDRPFEPQRSLAFSKIILRPQDEPIFVSSESVRIHAIEYLRGKGLNALGAESLVFDQDKSDQAELALGGTLTSVECTDSLLHHCLVEFEWEVFDVRRQEVVYRARVWGEFHGETKEGLSQRVISGALDRLLEKQKFRELLREEAPTKLEPVTTATDMAACTQAPVPLETSADHALDAVVIISDDSGFGSGFFVSDGPFVLTAAHVVRG